MKLKVYCTISLLGCMGKVIEKVVAELLSKEAEQRGLLSDGQFGTRSGGLPLIQQPSWSTEQMQHGWTVT